MKNVNLRGRGPVRIVFVCVNGLQSEVRRNEFRAYLAALKRTDFVVNRFAADAITNYSEKPTLDSSHIQVPLDVQSAHLLKMYGNADHVTEPLSVIGVDWKNAVLAAVDSHVKRI